MARSILSTETATRGASAMSTQPRMDPMVEAMSEAAYTSLGRTWTPSGVLHHENVTLDGTPAVRSCRRIRGQSTLAIVITIVEATPPET
jgi:hypothetical protein